MVSLATLLNIAVKPAHSIECIPERCLRKRLNTNNCTKCLDACVPGALTLKGRSIVFDSSSCTQCMACITACPQDVFISNFDILAMLSELQHKSTATVTCERRKSLLPDEISLPCLGAISRHLLVAVGMSGCQKVQFDISGCQECDNLQAARQFLRIYHKTVHALSDVLTTGLELAQTASPKESHLHDRRSYLSHLKKKVGRASQDSLTFLQKTVPQCPQKHRRVPFKVKLIQDLLRDSDEITRNSILPFFTYSLSINEKCDCCPLCKGICPTGAITIERAETGKTLRHNMDSCSGCGLCVEFCKKGALSLTGPQ